MSPWFLHADGIAVTASERTMGLPAVVLQSALQTATAQPSVSMRAGPQARGRGLMQGRAEMPGLPGAPAVQLRWTRSLRDGNVITAATYFSA